MTRSAFERLRSLAEPGTLPTELTAMYGIPFETRPTSEECIFRAEELRDSGKNVMVVTE